MNKDEFDKLPQDLRIDILIKWYGIQPLFYDMIFNPKSINHIERCIEDYKGVV